MRNEHPAAREPNDALVKCWLKASYKRKLGEVAEYESIRQGRTVSMSEIAREAVEKLIDRLHSKATRQAA